MKRTRPPGAVKEIEVTFAQLLYAVYFATGQMMDPIQEWHQVSRFTGLQHINGLSGHAQYLEDKGVMKYQPKCIIAGKSMVVVKNGQTDYRQEYFDKMFGEGAVIEGETYDILELAGQLKEKLDSKREEKVDDQV